MSEKVLFRTFFELVQEPRTDNVLIFIAFLAVAPHLNALPLEPVLPSEQSSSNALNMHDPRIDLPAKPCFPHVHSRLFVRKSTPLAPVRPEFYQKSKNIFE